MSKNVNHALKSGTASILADIGQGGSAKKKWLNDSLYTDACNAPETHFNN